MSYARAMGTAATILPPAPPQGFTTDPMAYTTPAGATNTRGGYVPSPLTMLCPPGYGMVPQAGGPARCVQLTSIAQAQLVPPPMLPVSDWRTQIGTMLEGVARLVFTLPQEILAQLMALATGTPAVQQAGEGFSRALRDPNQSDAQVADKLRVLNDSYQSLKPRMPAPAVRIFDPIMDGAINLVPANIRPPTLLPSTALTPSPFDSVPWLWVAGSFVGGMLACSFLGGPKKTTPNRRRRRSR